MTREAAYKLLRDVFRHIVDAKRKEGWSGDVISVEWGESNQSYGTESIEMKINFRHTVQPED